MALCACFRNNTQVANDNQRPLNRKSIQKNKNEMDLIDANERRESEMNGLYEQEGWMETRNTNNIHSYNGASNGFNKLSNSGRRD